MTDPKEPSGQAKVFALDDRGLPMYHSVTWLIEGENVYGKIKCDAPEGATCREVCAADPPCEEVCCGEDPDTGEEHPMRDSGYCNALEWLTQDRVEVYYAGEPHAAVSGPIQTYWHPGEFMVWTYPGHTHAYRKEFGHGHPRCACGARQPRTGDAESTAQSAGSDGAS